jgi:hypothetical protein
MTRGSIPSPIFVEIATCQSEPFGSRSPNRIKHAAIRAGYKP